MVDELNTPTHRWHQPRNNISLPNTDFSKQTIYDSGIQKIDAWINLQPWGSPIPALFAAGEQGAWYDPSDINTLFQDSAGTTPVTAAGQPVGLMLDKSQGLAVGSDVASGPWINTFSTAFDTFSSSSSDGFTAATSAAKTGIRVGVPCTFVAGQPYVVSFTLTATNASVTGFWFSDNGLGGTLAIQNPAQVTSGVRYRAQGVAPAGATHLMLVITATGAASVSLSGLTANALPGNHATQATAGSRPLYQIDGASRPYLSFDGVDDSMVTPTITPGTDKAQVFAGVRKLSDATLGTVVELSNAITTNAGAIALLAPIISATANYGFGSRGSAAQAFAVGSGYAAPITSVLTGIGDIANDVLTLRVNGVQAATSTVDQGTGNYLAYPMYLGRRGGTSLPFIGQLYSLTVRFGATPDAGTISTVETWVNSRTGAY